MHANKLKHLSFCMKQKDRKNKPAEYQGYASSVQREAHGVHTHVAFEVVDPKL